MNKKERVEAALRGETVDRVPVSVWTHDYKGDGDMGNMGSIQSLMESIVEHFIRYDWDFLKVNPRSTYFAEAWKARYRPSDQKNTPPIFESSPVRGSSDWKRLKVLEPDRGLLLEQLRLLQLLSHQVGYDAHFIQTVFCPLGVACSLVGDDPTPVQYSMREDRSALHTGLRIITETLSNYAIACMEQGATGIFYTTRGWASEGFLTLDQYREFGEQYDREFLDAIKSRSKMTVLHNSGNHIYFDMLGAYPVHALSWDVFAPGNPNLLDGKKRFGKAAMAGLNQHTLATGSPGQIQDEIAHTLEDVGTQYLLLAPASAIAPETPTKNLEAIRRVLS
jgi:uroporphyrinogen decarboxylase